MANIYQIYCGLVLALPVYEQPSSEDRYIYADVVLPDLNGFSFCMWLKWTNEEYHEKYLVSIANSGKEE